jgi:polyisoprenoid-binding protein YceI
VDGKINRKDFGLTWSMLTESGGLIVGEEVKVHFDVELIREG